MSAAHAFVIGFIWFATLVTLRGKILDEDAKLSEAAYVLVTRLLGAAIWGWIFIGLNAIWLRL